MIMIKTLKNFVSIFFFIAVYFIGITTSKVAVQSPDVKGYRIPEWGQEYILTSLQQSLNVTGWDAEYLTKEAEIQNAGCRNAAGWLKDWSDLTGNCLTTVDSGYIGCVGGASYQDFPIPGQSTPSPGEMQELYKKMGYKIIEGWRERNVFDDPDVDWIKSQNEVYVGCYINPFCEKFNISDDPADLAIESPGGTGTFEGIFVLACNLGTNENPSVAEYDPEAGYPYQQELDISEFDIP